MKENDGRSPLHLAAAKGDVETVKVLVAAGAALDARDRSGSTPLHLAAAGQHTDVVKLLIESGADASGRNESRAASLSRPLNASTPRAIPRNRSAEIGNKVRPRNTAMTNQLEPNSPEYATRMYYQKQVKKFTYSGLAALPLFYVLDWVIPFPMITGFGALLIAVGLTGSLVLHRQYLDAASFKRTGAVIAVSLLIVLVTVAALLAL